MRLTLKYRLKLCFEILTYRSGHAHHADDKGFSLFMNGYNAGFKDGSYNVNLVVKDALNKLLNDCINFDGGKLSDCILAHASRVLKQVEINEPLIGHHDH